MPNPPSPNFGERRAGARPRLVVLHYTGMGSAQAARERLCSPEHEVSAHYLITAQGEVDPLVPEHLRAWHAGAGQWAGLSDINSFSIGIELDNPGDRPFCEPQMNALQDLLAGICLRWDIPAMGVIGHSDMAPDRKIDPGPRFDWRRLALLGLSVWPDDPQPAPSRNFLAAARAFGYPDLAPDVILGAFRRRFRPTGMQAPLIPDEWDAGLAVNLAERFGSGT